MRVAVVTLDTQQSRASNRTARLDRVTRMLAANGNDVTVFCNQWWDGSVDTFEQDDVTYRALTSNRSIRGFAARLPIALRKVKPDIVHTSYWPPSAAVAATTGKLLGSHPVLLDWYGDKPVDANRRMVRSALSRPSSIVTPSRYASTRVREIGTDLDTTVIPASIDIDRIRSIPAAEGPDIVTARHLDEAANVDMMLLGLAELRDRDWQAMVIGDGPARDRFEQKAKELRIADRVRFVGNIPRDQRIAHYKAAHVFVQTAERCMFGVELLWALASGCAGIVDYQEESAAHELVEHLDRGFRTTSSEELSNAIIASADQEERTFNDAFEAYDHEAVFQQYLDVYDELLS